MINLGAGVIISTILFDTASAAAYTIGSGGAGAQTLTINDAGAVTMNATVANNELVNANIVLGTAGATYTFTNNSLTNSLTFAGGITGGTTGAKILTVAGAGNTTISGAITTGAGSSVALLMSGTGVLTLGGANAYAGTTTVNVGGTIRTSASNVLADASTLTLRGGTIDLAGNSDTVNGTGGSAINLYEWGYGDQCRRRSVR